MVLQGATRQFGLLNWEEPMPIVRLLEHEAFSPEDISVITQAFESAVSVLQLTERADSLTVERTAKKIIEYARTGERDPTRLRNHAIKSL
jgi:hypothetical protein